MRLLIALVPLLLCAACTGSASNNQNLELRFVVQPGTVLQGEVLAAFEVRIIDLDIGVVADLNGMVELTIETNPSGGLAILEGTAMKSMVNGRVVFDDIKIATAGAGWELRAHVVDLAATDAVSQPFTIRPPFQVLDFNLMPSATDVPLNFTLEWTFSSEVAFASVNGDTIQITDLTTNVGDPAGGRFLVFGNIVRFESRISQLADLSDSGLLPKTIYSVAVQALGDAGVRSIQGDRLSASFGEAFSTRDTAFLPNPMNLADPANHSQLPLFFADEGIENGGDPCDRAAMPAPDRDSPQVVLASPTQGAVNVGVVAGALGGITYVQLQTISLTLSEPYSHWRANAANIVVRNTDTNETFDLSITVVQSRFFAELALSVRDLDSPFSILTVPAGNYVLEISDFSDLSGNALVNSGTCTADGTFRLSFTTSS